MVRRVDGRTSCAARGSWRLAAAVASLLMLVACTSDGQAVTSTLTIPTDTAASSVTAAATVPLGISSPGAPPPSVTSTGLAPLTAMPAEPALATRPVLAVKVDNAPQAWPQAGLNAADIVFEENVEGWTRFVALFHSAVPPLVGPIRSARTQDIDILSSLGAPVLLWSGGNDNVQRAIASSPIIDASVSAQPDAYDRDPTRPPPHNLFARPADVGSAVGPALESVASLFSYGMQQRPPQPGSSGATPVEGVDLRMAGGMEAAWRWDAVAADYVRTQRREPHVDTDGEQVTTTSVVIMVTRYRPSAADIRSPEAVTTGTGEVVVLSGGRAVAGLWSRPDAASPWTLAGLDGGEIALPPGRTWVELVEADQFTIIRGAAG
jgi:hypothetical protein